MILLFFEHRFNDCFRFRLLNSEIGNDQKLASHSRERRLGFRLLNSEIGNDHFQ